MEWQPIETAPNDGEILVAEMCPTGWLISICEIHGADFLFDNETGMSRDLAMLVFSHWMPLPEPPEGA